jgi:hypothetical protein
MQHSFIYWPAMAIGHPRYPAQNEILSVIRFFSWADPQVLLQGSAERSGRERAGASLPLGASFAWPPA